MRFHQRKLSDSVKNAKKMLLSYLVFFYKDEGRWFTIIGAGETDKSLPLYRGYMGVACEGGFIVKASFRRF